MVDLAGAIDFHVHAGPEIFPRIGNAIEIAERARDRGMAGLVFKAHHEPSVTRAVLVGHAVPFIELWGGITLNGFIGGINPIAVAATLEMGGRVVWMPTMHARNHIQHLGAGTYGIPTLTLSNASTLAHGITILDERGSLTPETQQVIDLAHLHNAAVATSHLGEDEIAALVRRCRERDVRCVVTHAFFPKHSHDFLIQMAQSGAYIELSAVIAYPMNRHLVGGMTLAMARDVIQEAGPERVVISSDAGQVYNPWPAEILESFLNCLNAVGISEHDLREMVTTRPREILGVA